MKDTLIANFCVKACEAASTDRPYGLSEVCDLAHEILTLMHPDTEHDVEEPEGVFRYTDTGQELFNGYFDEVEGALSKIGLEYNLFDSTWKVKEEDDGKLVQ